MLFPLHIRVAIEQILLIRKFRGGPLSQFDQNLLRLLFSYFMPEFLWPIKPLFPALQTASNLRRANRVFEEVPVDYRVNEGPGAVVIDGMSFCLESPPGLNSRVKMQLIRTSSGKVVSFHCIRTLGLRDKVTVNPVLDLEKAISSFQIEFRRCTGNEWTPKVKYHFLNGGPQLWRLCDDIEDAL